MKNITLTGLFFLFLINCSFGQDAPDDKVNKLLRKFGIEQSKVMETAFYLTDVYGPQIGRAHV